MLKTNRAYSRNLVQHSVLARKRNFNFQSGKFNFYKKKKKKQQQQQQTNKQKNPAK